MLNQICGSICNYFIRDRFEGRFEIEDGMISLPLLEGQRFLIQGSVLNDGMYTYHDTGIKDDDDSEAVGLHDETWAGTICALAVPPTLIALSAEIKSWVDANSDALNSPMQSESFNGYSYSLKTSGNGGSAYSWQDHFRSALNQWRKVCL